MKLSLCQNLPSFDFIFSIKTEENTNLYNFSSYIKAPPTNEASRQQMKRRANICRQEKKFQFGMKTKRVLLIADLRLHLFQLNAYFYVITFQMTSAMINRLLIIQFVVEDI